MNTDEEIRDWYAGQALVGLLSAPSQYPVTPNDGHVARAFDIADAMMKERQKRAYPQPI